MLSQELTSPWAPGRQLSPACCEQPGRAAPSEQSLAVTEDRALLQEALPRAPSWASPPAPELWGQVLCYQDGLLPQPLPSGSTSTPAFLTLDPKALPLGTDALPVPLAFPEGSLVSHDHGLGRPRPGRCAQAEPGRGHHACLCGHGFQGRWFPSLPFSQSSPDGLLPATSSHVPSPHPQPKASPAPLFSLCFPSPAEVPSVGLTCWTPP